MGWEIVILILLIALSVLGFLAAVQPARASIYKKIRAGLIFVLLFVRNKQYDDLSSRKST